MMHPSTSGSGLFNRNGQILVKYKGFPGRQHDRMIPDAINGSAASGTIIAANERSTNRSQVSVKAHDEDVGGLQRMRPTEIILNEAELRRFEQTSHKDLTAAIDRRATVRLHQVLPLPTEERLYWERKLNRHFNSCGCSEGAIGMFVGVTITLAVYLVQHGPWSAWNTGVALMVPLALLILGKSVGRKLGSLRFRNGCKLLLARLARTARQGAHHE